MTRAIPLVAICLAIGLPVQTLAQQSLAWPAKPMTLIVPTTIGGGNDSTARLVASGLSKSLGKPIVVKNVPGAGTAIGAAEAAKAPPDGYTLFSAAFASVGLLPLIKNDLPFQSRDFQPVSQMSDTINILVVSPTTVRATSVPELVVLLKANPGKFNYGSAGVGNLAHLAMELLKLRAGVDVSHVPYKGGNDVLAALMSGQVELAFLNSSSGLQNIKAGQIRAVGVLTGDRIPELPDVPVIRDSIPNIETLSPWLGIFVPPGTPRPIVDRLSKETQAYVSTKEAKDGMAKFGAYAIGSTPEALAAKIASDIRVYSDVIKQANIKFE